MSSMGIRDPFVREAAHALVYDVLDMPVARVWVRAETDDAGREGGKTERGTDSQMTPGTTVVGNCQRALKRLLKLAGVPRAHAHRFRHTFAKRLRMKGVPLERVAVLMGHRSPSITLKHYASWVKERQEQREADVKRVWDCDGDEKQNTKPLKRPESAIQTLYSDSTKWLN
jgi:hypothetical protein